MWTQIRPLLKEQSDLVPHYLPVCKNRFEQFARIFSRRHKLTTFLDAGFLGIFLKVNVRDSGLNKLLLNKIESKHTTEPTIGSVRPAKTQISKYINPVWKGFLFISLWIAPGV